MNCNVVELKPAKVIGMVYQGKGEGGEIPAMWQVFNVRYKEVKNPDLFKFYGLCYGYQDDGAFSYMSGVGIIAGDDKVAEIPSGMSLQEIPGGKYAVFTFKDDISKIGLLSIGKRIKQRLHLHTILFRQFFIYRRTNSL